MSYRLMLKYFEPKTKLIDLCKDCEKSGNCYFEKNELVCKYIYEYEKNLKK